MGFPHPREEARQEEASRETGNILQGVKNQKSLVLGAQEVKEGRQMSLVLWGVRVVLTKVQAVRRRREDVS